MNHSRDQLFQMFREYTVIENAYRAVPPVTYASGALCDMLEKRMEAMCEEIHAALDSIEPREA